VAENRRLLVDDLGLAAERVAMGWQVHGTDLLDWGAPPDEGGFAAPGAKLAKVDGHVTAVPGLGLLVLVADCLPVALIGGGRAAMLHCGWRGLAGGIIAGALEHFDEPPAAAIGPGIGKCCYEVGDEVLVKFASVLPGGLEGVSEGRMLDLRGIARRLLEAGGVTRIEDVDYCTSCRPDLFFSHRRDRGVTGRQGGIAWLT
jgi:YfiH family protein